MDSEENYVNAILCSSETDAVLPDPRPSREEPE
jgi:hypothetical protein